MSCDYWNK